MLNRKSVMRTALATVAGLGVASSSWAQTATQNLTVTTQVKESCVITLPVNLTFADYNPLFGTALTTTGSITLTCTKGSNGVTVGVGDGGNFGNGTYVAGKRSMAGTVGGEFLAYDLFQPNTYGAAGVATANPFTGTSGAGVLTVGASAFTTGSTPVLVKIFGSIPVNQDVTGQSGAGNTFTDTVVATVYF